MNSIITEMARYLFAMLMIFYVYATVRGATTKKDTTRNAAGIVQNMMMFSFHFLGYLILYMKDGDVNYAILYAAQLVFFIVFLLMFTMLYPNASRLLLNNMCMLIAVGFVILARLSFEKCLRQFIFVAAGGLLSFFIPWMIKKVRSFRNLSFLYFIVGTALLAAVLISDEVFGAKLAITVGSVSIQPTEFVKIIYVMFVAAMFNASDSFKRIVVTSLAAALHVVILVASKDLGAALIFFVVYVFMLYDATRKWYYILVGMLAGAGASVIAYKLFAHIRVRVLIWLDPWTYIEDRGYQIAQSLFSIGTGSWFGTGLNQGSPNMIPVPEKDFIFSAICEEFGIVFAIGLILLCLTNLMLMLNIASMCRTQFYRLTAVGIGVTYAFQVFLTIGGGIKLIPLTGVTLPFVSYGGSSMLASIIMVAIVNGMYVMRESDVVVRKADAKNGGKVRRKRRRVDISTDRSSDAATVVILSVFAAIFALLIGYLVYFNVKTAPQILNNSYNTRNNAREEKVSRGSIMASNGSILAYTEVDETGSESRVYPYGRVFSHVVGMSTRGKSGIEGMGNADLLDSGSNIVNKAYSEISGKKLVGNNVVTTLDVQLQKAAYLAMENNKGAIVVMEPSTGRILAMVSKPDYNPNDAIDQWETWLSYSSNDSVLFNRATQGLYPPGSTFKMLTALQYVRENPDYESYRYSCKGSTDVMGSVIHCYNSTAHGYETLSTAFANSCNSAFSNMGLDVDGDAFNSLCNDFLFNQDIPLSIETSRSSFTMKGNSSVGEKMQTAIGQGKTQVTPLNNAIITATIANDGVMMKPYLIEKVVSQDNKVIKEYEPEQYSTPITEPEAQAVKGFMREVCTKGTGRSFRNTSYEVAGKTGTAQYDDVSEDSHSWFVGFAPYDSPEIVISVVLEGGYSGYDSAQEVAKKVFDTYFTK